MYIALTSLHNLSRIFSWTARLFIRIYLFFVDVEDRQPSHTFNFIIHFLSSHILSTPDYFILCISMVPNVYLVPLRPCRFYLQYIKEKKTNIRNDF